MKKHRKPNRIFCKGLFCRRTERKNKCIECFRFVCNVCSVREGKKLFCIDCYLKTFLPHWDKLNKEFDKMIIDLFNKDTKKEKDKSIIKI